MFHILNTVDGPIPIVHRIVDSRTPGGKDKGKKEKKKAGWRSGGAQPSPSEDTAFSSNSHLAFNMIMQGADRRVPSQRGPQNIQWAMRRSPQSRQCFGTAIWYSDISDSHAFILSNSVNIYFNKLVTGPKQRTPSDPDWIFIYNGWCDRKRRSIYCVFLFAEHQDSRINRRRIALGIE